MYQGGANHGLRAYGIGQIVSLGMGKEGSKGKKANNDKVFPEVPVLNCSMNGSAAHGHLLLSAPTCYCCRIARAVSIALLMPLQHTSSAQYRSHFAAFTVQKTSPVKLPTVPSTRMCMRARRRWLCRWMMWCPSAACCHRVSPSQAGTQFVPPGTRCHRFQTRIAAFVDHAAQPGKSPFNAGCPAQQVSTPSQMRALLIGRVGR
jgi:hypothetical protein